ncbi:MAG: SLBB domain-containing protein [Betaproteobacteria bacterium]
MTRLFACLYRSLVWAGVAALAISPLVAAAQYPNSRNPDLSQPLFQGGVSTPQITNQQPQGQARPGQARPGQLPADVRPGQYPPAVQDQLAPREGQYPPFQQPVPARVERNEFQDFIAQSVGKDVPLFGHTLFADVPSTFAPLDRIPVTADYVVGPGDEILIRAWGQVDIDYRAVVDRNGTIHIPQVGTVTVGGLRYQELNGFLRNAIGRVFRNFDLNVNLGQLRSIQVYIVGQANRPGTYTVSSLSTLVNALFAAGGPSPKGSMRRIQLKRGADVVTEFDLYDLLLKGDKSKDAKLLPGDVIYIPPVGQLVAIVGSINVPAIYELKDKASLQDLIDWSGGLAATAAGQRVTVERSMGRTARQVDQFMLDREGLSREISSGDVVTVYAVSPRIQNAVSLRGFVAQPARFPWRDGLRVRDLIPDREALISPDYWLRRNALIRAEDWLRRPLSETQAATPGRFGVGTSAQLAARSAANQAFDQSQLRADLKRSSEINWEYAVVERIKSDDLTTQLLPFNLSRAILEGDPQHNLPLSPGDVITIFSKDDIQVPIEKQTKYVKLEGELRNPGVYQLLPGETLRQLIVRTGGFSENAYVFGSEFSREATRKLQQQRLDEALDRLSQEIERSSVVAAQGALTREDAESAKLQSEGQRRLLTRLREIRASGRIILEMQPDGATAALPDVVLEDGDRFLVPSRPSTVGVLGAVYNQNSFLYQPGKRVSEYLAQAGGPTRDADTARVYVVRADGAVIGGGTSSWLGSGVRGERLMPGDTIVVPEDLDRFRFTKELKDWSQIFYQFALGVAGLKVLRDL